MCIPCVVCVPIYIAVFIFLKKLVTKIYSKIKNKKEKPITVINMVTEKDITDIIKTDEGRNIIINTIRGKNEK